MNVIHRAGLLFCSLCCSCGLAVSARAADVLVFAAASLSDALREIGAAYQSNATDTVAFSLEASSTLARQISAGAPADIFVSADQAKMDDLENASLLLDGSRVTLLSNTLVVVTDGSVKLRMAADLTNAAVTRLALAEPASVPAGIYAKAYLEHAGLWAAISNRVVPVANVRAVLAAVESGNAEAGFVYRTDAMISRRARLGFQIPADQTPPISYPAAIIRASPHVESAQQFLAFLKSPAASAIFKKYGFIPTTP